MGRIVLLQEFVLNADRFVPQDVHAGFARRDRDSRIFGQDFLGGGPPFLKFDWITDHLRKDALNLGGACGSVRILLEDFHNEVCLLFCNHLRDYIWLGLLAGEQMLRRKDLHRDDAEARIHPVTFLPLEIDDQL